MRTRHAGSRAALVLGLLCSLAGCHGPGRAQAVASTGCGGPRNERLDPASVIHLFPGAPEPHYLTDPPTSGPHQLGPPPVGVVTTPIPRPRQVAMLETGFVIVQFQDLSAEQQQALDRVAEAEVTVAPAIAPFPAPVVVTAWTWKLECRSVDAAAVAAIDAFISAHRGVGFSGGPPTTRQTGD